MSTFKSIGQVANYKPLARCGMEELAARQSHIEPSSGILFARNVDGEEKIKARQQVLDLFHPNKWPRRLNILTLPGVLWRFERKLLGVRESGWMKAPKPRRTSFTGVENDRTVFFGAVPEMPGLHTPEGLLKQVKPYPFAEMGVKTRYGSFFFANVDELMAYDAWEHRQPYRNVHGWDAAWLDYTGPMSVERLAIIKRFYERFIHEVLIVTVLRARWNKATSNAIDKAGGHSQWLRQHLEGEVLHDLEYFDTSPMAQFAVKKQNDLDSPIIAP